MTQNDKRLQERFLQATLDRLQDNPPGTRGERRVLRRQLWLAFQTGLEWKSTISSLRLSTGKPFFTCEMVYIETNGNVKKAIKLLGGAIK